MLRPFRPLVLTAFTVLASMLASIAHAAGSNPPDKRVALVIGNGSYKSAPLKNPVNDARAMATALQGLGFEVIERENAGQRDMNRAITAFNERLMGGGTGLFYYAGHGMQVKGRNYLLPVDAEIESEIAVRNEAIDVDQVLDGMTTAGNPLNIVILDACRNNPFERRFRGGGSGLAQIDAPKGALIAYATAPGKVAADGEGANGLYTSELLRAISEPNLRVEDVFKHVRAHVASATNDLQVPWEASSLVGDFYFKRQADDTPVELAFWQSVQASSDSHDFQSYLDQYPNGRFAALARNRLRALQTTQQRADETQRRAEAQKAAEAQRATEAQRAAAAEVQRQADATRLAEQQRQLAAEEAQRRAEADRLAALEAEVRRLRAAAPPPPSPAPPPAAAVAPPPVAPAPVAAATPRVTSPAPAVAPQVAETPRPPSQVAALSAPPRASLEGKWSGRLGSWRFAFTVSGDEISGSLGCGNNIYKFSDAFAASGTIDVTANRVIGGSPFPTSIRVRGTFPTLTLVPSGVPGGCNRGEPFELKPASSG